MHAPVPPDETTSTPISADAGAETPASVTIASDPDVEAGIRAVMAAVPLATRHAVARAALRAGVRHLLEEPMRMIGLLRDGRNPPIDPKGSER